MTLNGSLAGLVAITAPCACVDAMALAIVIMIKKRYGTIDADELRRLRG